MKTSQKIWIALGLIVAASAVVAVNLYTRRAKGATVTIETIKTRDLEAVVSASGKIQPKRTVNISSDTMGRVVNLAVNQGDRVKTGQFLLQIDPKSLRTRVDGGTASLEAAQADLAQMRQAAETARVQLLQAQQTLKRQQELWARELTTRETLERAENDLHTAESTLQEREKQAVAQDRRIMQERASLESAQYDLSKVRIVSPIDGIVTARNIQEGETAVVGTMNNAGTVLLTLADMSIIQGEIEVDETNIPSVLIGQLAKITIDAIPDKSFKGHVTEIGNSPIQSTSSQQTTTTTQATNFKVVVMLDEQVPDVRPGFTCTADITTATRTGVVAAPIPAVAVREVIYDAHGTIVKHDSRIAADPNGTATDLKPGETRKEVEGVFVLREGRAEFVPIKVGIAGERYFEVLAGLKDGDQVITGPYNAVRGLTDGDPVKLQPPPKNR